MRVKDFKNSSQKTLLSYTQNQELQDKIMRVSCLYMWGMEIWQVVPNVGLKQSFGLCQIYTVDWEIDIFSPQVLCCRSLWQKLSLCHGLMIEAVSEGDVPQSLMLFWH